MDFTLKTYHTLLVALQNQGYAFLPFADFLQRPARRAVVLRHDVEKRYENALRFASMQHKLGIRASYYFRILNGHFQRDIIAQIAHMGHEIGYHYDDLSQYKGDHEQAIRRFEKHLNMLRSIAPVRTICMEGAPLSKHDNRHLWKHYNYRDYGIIGEPYFDVDFSKVLYLTDTGRRWDGDLVSMRDKVEGSKGRRVERSKGQKVEKSKGRKVERYRWSSDIIKAANEGQLLEQVMITVHPQRWTDRFGPWLWELVWQNVKNAGKYFLVKSK